LIRCIYRKKKNLEYFIFRQVTDCAALILCWENLGILSRSFLVKSHNNTFRGVNWEILQLSKVLLLFTEKGGDDCFDGIHGSVDKLS
jgi:hypothetical protein